MADETPPSGIKFGRNIELGHVLQFVGVLVAMGIPALLYVVFAVGDAQQTQERLVEFKTSVAQQFAEVKAGIASLRTDIGGLPDERARIEVINRWISTTDLLHQQIDGRMKELERSDLSMRSQLDSINRASGQRLR